MLRRMNRLSSDVAALPWIAVAWLCLAATAHAEVTSGVDPEAGLPFWEWRDSSVSLRLVQRQPDQTRAFFMARGFSREAVERIARRCVFQTVFRNVSAGTRASAVDYDLRDWTVRGADTPDAGMLTREYWAEQWAELDIAQSARIAFEWALFPTAQTYHPGDYNWGMSVFDLAPGAVFDVTVRWRQGSESRSATLEGMRCAPDGPADSGASTEIETEERL